MKILVTGKGGIAGSWIVRGEQLGSAMGATIKAMATVEECRTVDFIVVVKRCPEQLLWNIRESGTPWAWDIVDAFPQPECSTWTQSECQQWITAEIARLNPTKIIWPTQAMQYAANRKDGLVLYHHHRPGIELNPIRDRIEAIGYEGSSRYLEGWERTIAQACERIGAAFMVNPPRLADCDVVLALRGGRWNGYAQKTFKSNIKLANAHGSGTPFIGALEAGYLETQSGAEHFASSKGELFMALDWLESKDARLETQKRFLAKRITVDDCAAQLKRFLCE